MKAKYLFVAVCLGIGFLSAGTAQAGFVASGQQIQVLGFEGTPFAYGGGRGGPFRVKNFSNPSVPDLISFCLERDEYLGFNTTYTAQVSTIAQLGGVNTNSGDPLDTKTAYLYSNFVKGTLNSLLTGWTANELKGVSTNLQEVFWFVEQELPTFKENSLSVNAKKLYDLAIANTKDNGGSLYHVGVMNLYDANGGHKQSLLTTTAPEPATVVIWSVFGVCGLLYARRRQKATR
ncbi:MAG: hypothetical protein ACYC3X_06075 [Pirellulaceae bacterium]